MSKRTGNGRKQQLAAARLLKLMNGMGNSKHYNMHNHFSFSFLAEQTDPLIVEEATVCCQSAIDKVITRKNKENSK